ncbi:ATP-dependent DNA helicase RRM3-like, partial [Aphis craccivora]
MTINKSRGQSLIMIGIGLREECFSHGQAKIKCTKKPLLLPGQRRVGQLVLYIVIELLTCACAYESGIRRRSNRSATIVAAGSDYSGLSATEENVATEPPGTAVQTVHFIGCRPPSNKIKNRGNLKINF